MTGLGIALFVISLICFLFVPSDIRYGHRTAALITTGWGAAFLLAAIACLLAGQSGG